MKFSEVKELIEIVNSSDLSYFEASIENGYVKMDKSLSRSIDSKINTTSAKEDNNLNKDIKPKMEENITSNKQVDEVTANNEDFEFIKSPIVGTFYKASSPESDPFVCEGQKVSKGDVLCIVEAMKLMNEINAEFDFEVVSVLVEDGTMVEYNQDLFKVRRK